MVRATRNPRSSLPIYRETGRYSDSIARGGLPGEFHPAFEAEGTRQVSQPPFNLWQYLLGFHRAQGFNRNDVSPPILLILLIVTNSVTRSNPSMANEPFTEREIQIITKYNCFKHSAPLIEALVSRRCCCCCFPLTLQPSHLYVLVVV